MTANIKAIRFSILTDEEQKYYDKSDHKNLLIYLNLKFQ